MVPKFYNLKLHSLGFSRNLHYFIYNGKYSNTCSRMNAQFHTNISPIVVTVLTDRHNCSAISLLLIPCAMHATTPFSRSLNKAALFNFSCFSS